MSKIINIIIDSDNNKYFVAYDSGKSKMYTIDKLPNSVKNFIVYNGGDNSKIHYAVKAAEQATTEEAKTEEQATAEETTTAAEQATAAAEQAEEQTTAAADAEQEITEAAAEERIITEAAAEQRRQKKIKIRSNFYIYCDVINNTASAYILDTINGKNRFKGNTETDYYYFKKTAEQATAEAEQQKNRSKSKTAEAAKIRNNLTIANSNRNNFYNAVMTAVTTAAAAEAAAEKAKTKEEKAEAKKAKAAAEAAAAVLKTEEAKETAKAAADAEQATKKQYKKSVFEEIQTDFYKCYKAFKQIKTATTATEAAEINNNYAKAIDNYCMILVLSVLKKIENVVRTGRTDKTKADTNYNAIRNIKLDLITSHNAYINLNDNIEKDIKMSLFDFDALIKKSFASDGIELLNVAKETLLTLIKKAEAKEINVDINNNNFLDLRYDYVDINKKVWSSIKDTTYIDTVTTEAATAEEAAEAAAEARAKKADAKQAATIEAAEITTKYIVVYLSGRTKVFYNNNVPKTVLTFLEHEQALKSGCYDPKKNIYLVKRNTCIATEIHKAVRNYIQSEKTMTTNNSYCYLADITTITDSDSGKTYSFDTYKKIEKYNTALIYNNHNELFTSETDNNNIDDITTQIFKNLKMSDNYKKVFTYALQGYKYNTIAKKTGINENTAKSSLREIRKKILKLDLIGSKQKYNSLKTSIKDINKQIKEATTAAEQAAAEAEQAEATAAKYKAKVKAAAAVIRNRSGRNKYIFRFKKAVFKNYIIHSILKHVITLIRNNFYIAHSVRCIPTAAEKQITILNAVTTATTAAADAKIKAAEAEATAEAKKADLKTYITDFKELTEEAITEEETAIYKTITETEKALNTCINIKYRKTEETETEQQKHNKKFIDIISNINNVVNTFINASDINSVKTTEEKKETFYIIDYKQQLKNDNMLSDTEQQYIKIMSIKQNINSLKRSFNNAVKKHDKQAAEAAAADILKVVTKLETVLNKTITIKYRKTAKAETATQKYNKKIVDIISSTNNTIDTFIKKSSIYSVKTADNKNYKITYKKCIKNDNMLSEAEQRYINAVRIQQKLKDMKKSYNEYAKTYNFLIQSEEEKIQYIDTITIEETAKYFYAIALNTFNIQTFKKLRYNSKKQKQNSKQQILNYRLTDNSRNIKLFDTITDNSGNIYKIKSNNSRNSDSNNIFVSYTINKKYIPPISAEAAEKATNKKYFETTSKRSYTDDNITFVFPLLLFSATTAAAEAKQAAEQPIKTAYNFNNVSVHIKNTINLLTDLKLKRITNYKALNKLAKIKAK